MRVAMFEILYMQDIPKASSVDAAVRLAKKYENEQAAAFINGILGSFIRGEAGG
jgi:N utilization substance protein B